MGDKSPKSKQKNKTQKQEKASASNKEKQRIISGKRPEKPVIPKKK